MVRAGGGGGGAAKTTRPKQDLLPLFSFCYCVVATAARFLSAGLYLLCCAPLAVLCLPGDLVCTVGSTSRRRLSDACRAAVATAAAGRVLPPFQLTSVHRVRRMHAVTQSCDRSQGEMCQARTQPCTVSGFFSGFDCAHDACMHQSSCSSTPTTSLITTR